MREREPTMPGTIDFDLPTGADEQLLVGSVFSEATAGGGASDDEKLCIALCVMNMSYYATYTQPGKTCYNDAFGDGTVLSAIKKAIKGYNSPQWKKIMESNALKSKDDLEGALIPSEIAHLKGAVTAAKKAIDANLPAKDPGSGRAPIQLNKANDSPPSPRQEKISHYALQTFYGFKSGRECQ
jgi:hypothetical protein